MPLRSVLVRVAAVAASALLSSGLAACGGGPAAPVLSAVGCGPARSVSYAGARASDCVASAAHHFVVAVSGYEVLVGNWKRATDDSGRHLICAGANVEDVSGQPLPVSAALFGLRVPSGATEEGAPSTTNGLAGRRLAPGEQEGGSVCWSDPGAGGQYQALFSAPAATGASPPRAVWLITFLPSQQS